MSLRKWAIAAAGTFGLAGCTSLQTLPDTYSSAGPAQALQGFPYALPMRQYDLVVTWSLEECANRPLAPGETVSADNPLRTTIVAKVASTPLLSAGERYLLNYRSLSGPTKTSDVTIETYPEGTLKSVNAVVEDRSAEIIANVARAGIAVASLAGGRSFSPPGTEGIVPSPLVGCTEAALRALAEVNSKKAALEAATKALDDQSDAVESLVLVGLYDTGRRAELLTALQALRGLNLGLDDAKAALAKARKPLQRVRNLRWPQDFGADVETATVLEMSPSDRLSFEALFETTLTSREPDAKDCTEEVSACLAKELPVFLDIRRVASLGAKCPQSQGIEPGKVTFTCRDEPPTSAPTPLGQDETPAARLAYRDAVDAFRFVKPVKARDREPDKGLFVRPPVQGRLVVCRKTKGCEQGQKDTLLWDEAMPVPQLGQLRFLPFENKMFQNNALVLALAKDGTVEKFQFASKSSVVERLSASAATVAEGLVSARKSIRDERAAKRTEKLAELDYEIGLKERQDKLKPPPVSTDAVEEDAEARQKVALKIELEVTDALVELTDKD